MGWRLAGRRNVCVWPVLAPAQAIARARERRGNAEFRMRNWGAEVCPRFVRGFTALSRRFGSACGWPCGSGAAICSACGLAALARWFVLGARLALRFWRGGLSSARGFAALVRRFSRRAVLRLCCGGFLGARLALRLWRGGLARREALRLWRGGFLGARPCGFGAVVCSRRAALRLWRGGLSSARDWPCGSVAVVFSARGWHCGSVTAICSWCAALRLWHGAFLGARLAMRFCCDDLARRAIGLAALARRFSRRAVGLAVLLRLFASVHACLFSFVRKKETACGILRSYSAGSRSPFVRSRSALRLSAFVGSLRVWPFICGDLDGVPRTLGTENGSGGAAFVRLCAATLAL